MVLSIKQCHQRAYLAHGLPTVCHMCRSVFPSCFALLRYNAWDPCAKIALQERIKFRVLVLSLHMLVLGSVAFFHNQTEAQADPFDFHRQSSPYGSCVDALDCIAWILVTSTVKGFEGDHWWHSMGNEPTQSNTSRWWWFVLLGSVIELEQIEATQRLHTILCLPTL